MKSPTRQTVRFGLGLFVGLAVAQQFARVKRAIDGDTIMLESGERVRLIGVDTPESVDPRRPVERFGKEASSLHALHVRRQTGAAGVRRPNADRDHKDNTEQRRTLDYVYLEDGTLLNTEIIRQAYGFVLTRYPFAHIEKFRWLKRQARKDRRGLWSE